MDFLYFLQTCREGVLSFLTPVFFIISEAGLMISIFAVLIIYWGFDKQGGKKIICGFAVSTCFSNVLKNIACINRPWILDSRLHVEPMALSSATGYSFPSGHSTTAASCYGGIAVWKKNNKLFSVLCWIFTAAVLFSRNWLGCHTLPDVLAGFAIGFIFMILSFYFFDRIESSITSEIIFLVISIIISAGIIIFLLVKPYPEVFDSNNNPIVDIIAMKKEAVKNVANYLGFVVGWFLERRFINFEIPVKTKQKCIFIIPGILIIGCLYKFILPLAFAGLDPVLGGFLNHFILFFSGIFLYPAVVKCLTKKC